MSSVPATGPALQLAIAFLNTYDLLEDPPDRLDARVAAGLARDGGFAELAASLAAMTRHDLDRLRSLRSRLYLVFAALDPDAKIAALNASMDEADLRPRIAIDETGHVRLAAARISTRHDPAGELAAVCVDALVQAMQVGGPDRFGTCAGDPCRCAYVDRTRAARQRFCCQLCNDRMAAAAYRSRRALS
jgi:putative stress-induced transcription regulator/CGNR zinc finger protein